MAAARAVGAAGGDAAKEAYDSDVLVDEFYAAFSDAERLEGGALDDGEEYAELMGQLMGLGGDLEGAETRYARKKKEVAAPTPRTGTLLWAPALAVRGVCVGALARRSVGVHMLSVGTLIIAES